MFLQTFASFPDVTFIWKYDISKDKEKVYKKATENIFLVDWMPQSDLLGTTWIEISYIQAYFSMIISCGHIRGKIDLLQANFYNHILFLQVCANYYLKVQYRTPFLSI
jgi:hypothetical protein